MKMILKKKWKKKLWSESIFDIKETDLERNTLFIEYTGKEGVFYVV